MKLIMRSEYDNLRLNPQHHVESDQNGDKQLVKIYNQNSLIAKRIKQKKSIRYFAIETYQQYMTEEES